MSHPRVRTQAPGPRPQAAGAAGEPRVHHVSHCSRLLAPLQAARPAVRTSGQRGPVSGGGLASLEELQAGA